jgi:hypothetical protein
MLCSKGEYSMERRRLMILIPESEFETLRRIADDEERTPTEQARWLLRRALRDCEPEARLIAWAGGPNATA